MINSKLFKLLLIISVTIFLSCSDDDKSVTEPEVSETSYYLESISATVVPMEGSTVFEEYFSAGFTDRELAGHIMSVTLAGNSAIYTYQQGRWVPKGDPLKFLSESLNPLKITLTGNGIQDGTPEGLLNSDALVYATDNQEIEQNLEIELRHRNAFVQFVFPNHEPYGNIVNSQGSVACRYGSSDTYGFFVEPTLGPITIDYETFDESFIGEIAPDSNQFENSVIYNLTVKEDVALPSKPYFGDNFISYTGPFVYNEGGKYRVLQAYNSTVDGQQVWNFIEDEYSELSKINVYSSDLNIRFSVDLFYPEVEYEYALSKPDKVLVASDLHGQLGAFVDLLQANGVINERYEWSYGKNFFVYNGDIFDRGRDDIPIAWLLYKLDYEAKAAGGRCLFAIGNHEDMIHRGSLGNVNAAHTAMVAAYGITYDKLWNEKNLYTQWLKTKNMIYTLDRDMIVHAGLHVDMATMDFSIDEINDWARLLFGATSKWGRGSSVYTTSSSSTGYEIFAGPIWYRGQAYSLQPEEELETILEYYDVDRIIVGHTEVSEVQGLYDNRVITVNVVHATNWAAGNRSGALLIEKNQYYSVDYQGNKTRLF